jgi:hypothetical protein
VPSTAEPTAAPMINCANVQTTISDSAVEMRSQMESKLATNARPSQRTAKPHTLVMAYPPEASLRPRSDRRQLAIAATHLHQRGERTNGVVCSRKYAWEYSMRTAGLQGPWHTPAGSGSRSHRPLRRLSGDPIPIIDAVILAGKPAKTSADCLSELNGQQERSSVPKAITRRTMELAVCCGAQGRVLLRKNFRPAPGNAA